MARPQRLRRWLTLLFVLLLIACYAIVVRPWHAHWGATPAEVAMPMPGDAYATAPAAVTTRAVTIHAPAAAVWPWLVQIGQGRGGWYSYDWLENLFAAGMHNADAIDPALQDLNVGDPMLFTQMGLHATVMALDPERSLVLDGGWTFLLVPSDAETTRLVVRYPAKDNAVYYFTLFEPAHFIMESGMMLGIKHRAEAAR